jgi:hypothetical protein
MSNINKKIINYKPLNFIEMDKEQKQPVDLTLYINVIQQRFYPAENRDEATHRFSTAEITEAIKQLNPGISVYDEHVFDAMIEGGFKFDIMPGAQSLIYQWLLKEN